MTNPDNVGGLVWYVCTSCMLMVQLPSDTPTLGRCQCSPKGWSLRRAKLPKGYELCRAAPAVGDMAVGEIGELGGKVIVLYSQDEIGDLPKGTKLYARPQDSAPAGSGEVEELVQKWREIAAATWPGFANDASNVNKSSANAYMHCADDLAALLRKLQQGAE